MKIERLEIADILLTPGMHGDPRGFFSETFRADAFAGQGVHATFVQDNHAFSSQKGVLRGLHFQIPPHAQGAPGWSPKSYAARCGVAPPSNP